MSDRLAEEKSKVCNDSMQFFNSLGLPLHLMDKVNTHLAEALGSFLKCTTWWFDCPSGGKKISQLM